MRDGRGWRELGERSPGYKIIFMPTTFWKIIVMTRTISIIAVVVIVINVAVVVAVLYRSGPLQVH